MKIQVSSLLLCGVLSLSTGCQPETDAPALKSRTESLSGEAGSWAPTAPKAKAYSTTAVVLRGTGEVLDAYSGSVQSYDPYSNTWRVRNSQCYPGSCGSVSMTELPSGQVLAEVLFPSRSGGVVAMMTYDPTTDLWTRLQASPNRRNQSVTLLDSGKVLVAGGYNFQSADLAFNGAEEYDPATDTFTFTGNMRTGRTEHTATRLYSGQVLVTGGFSNTSTLASAELYDPSTKTWTAAGSMSKARANHRAIRLFSGNVMVFSSSSNTTDTSVDVYDPYNARWFAGPPLPFTQPTSATLLYSGEVLVTNDAGQAALYSPSQDAWLPAASVTPSTATPSVLLQSGQVLRLNGGSSVSAVFTR